jgi:hypothetical protein
LGFAHPPTRKNPMRPPPDIQKTPTSDSRRNRPRAQHRQALVGRGHWHCQMHSYSYSKCYKYRYNYQLHGYSRSRVIIRDYTAACTWKTRLLEASSSRILIHSQPPNCTWEAGKGHCPHYPHFLQPSWGPLVVVFRSGGWPLGS